jgi:hypothetical protein
MPCFAELRYSADRRFRREEKARRDAAGILIPSIFPGCTAAVGAQYRDARHGISKRLTSVIAAMDRKAMTVKRYGSVQRITEPESTHSMSWESISGSFTTLINGNSLSNTSVSTPSELSADSTLGAVCANTGQPPRFFKGEPTGRGVNTCTTGLVLTSSGKPNAIAETREDRAISTKENIRTYSYRLT